MARWRCTYVTYECLSCLRTWKGTYWQPRDTIAHLDDLEGAQGGSTAQENTAKLTCTCDAPHVRIRPFRDSSGGTMAQVRASQRAVVYQFPDGTWSAPGTNDPNDPAAQSAIRDGAVRREFYHINELHDYQRARRKSDSDESTGRNHVIDFDQASLRQRDTVTMDIAHLHEREANLREAFRIIGGNSGRYEQALEAQRRRQQ